MDIVFEFARILSIGVFLYFGIACLASRQMVSEFERYGLARVRVLAGLLETTGALALLASYVFPSLVVIASGGLVLMMALGIGTRLRIRDPVFAMTPAASLLLLNVFIFSRALAPIR